MLPFNMVEHAVGAPGKVPTMCVDTSIWTEEFDDNPDKARADKAFYKLHDV